MTHTPRRTRALFALFIVSAALCGLCPAAAAQVGIEHIDNREAFAASASGISTIDFASVAPARGFGKYRPAEGLAAGGVTFRASGGARFGPGLIYVISAHYGGMNPLHNTGMLPHLGWGAPNQPGNASLDVSLPAGTTAVGCDLWTQQPYVSTVEVTATTADGRTHTTVVNTRARPAGSFVGFISDTSIVSVSFRPPKGQSGLLLDNFTYGRKLSGRRVQPTATAAAPKDANEGAQAQASRPTAPTGAQPPASRPGQSASSNAGATPATAASQSPTPSAAQSPTSAASVPSANQSSAAPGEQTAATTTTATKQPGQASVSAPVRATIAYVRGGREIRLIEADGSNDRRLWTHPLSTKGAEIHDLSWRPDGAELAFSSSHHSVVSLYHADIYGIRPDGTGLRKITNAPDHAELARYPKGTVQVTVRNDQPIYKQSQASAGVFFIYVVGADEPQALTLPPGSSKTLLFKSVADFGDDGLRVVAMYGRYRWFIPGVDVRAGRTINAPVFGISGDGHELFGAFRPTWRSDGSRVSYRSGLCVVSSALARPVPGEIIFQPMFAGEHPTGACAWDWGPGPALADQFIYSSNSEGEGSSVHRLREGGTHPGTKLHTFSELDLQLITDLRWLPDGSGFLYSFPDLAYGFANIFRYDFATKRATQLTSFEDEFVRSFDISPDGAWVVFERAKSQEDEESDLWLARADGRDARLLVRAAAGPSWR